MGCFFSLHPAEVLSTFILPATLLVKSDRFSEQYVQKYSYLSVFFLRKRNLETLWIPDKFNIFLHQQNGPNSTKNHGRFPPLQFQSQRPYLDLPGPGFLSGLVPFNENVLHWVSNRWRKWGSPQHLSILQVRTLQENRTHRKNVVTWNTWKKGWRGNRNKHTQEAIWSIMMCLKRCFFCSGLWDRQWPRTPYINKLCLWFPINDFLTWG